MGIIFMLLAFVKMISHKSVKRLYSIPASKVGTDPWHNGHDNSKLRANSSSCTCTGFGVH